jgi:hypothetical protein
LTASTSSHGPGLPNRSGRPGPWSFVQVRSGQSWVRIQAGKRRAHELQRGQRRIRLQRAAAARTQLISVAPQPAHVGCGVMTPSGGGGWGRGTQ